MRTLSSSVTRSAGPGWSSTVATSGSGSHGPTLAAAATRTDRVIGLAAVNTFGWRPSGVLLPTMLAVFGSAWMRWLDVRTGWLPAASTTRFGVGRHLDRDARRAFRVGMDAQARATMHHLFASARRSPALYAAADRALVALAERPLLTIFGALGDYLRFRPKWRRHYPDLDEVTIPWGLHFPMCDDPARTAAALDDWHRRRVQADRHRDKNLASSQSATPG